MQLLFDNVYRILPTKVTPSKYSSLFVKRPQGNLLFSCLGGHSSIEGSFDDIDALGGIALHLLGDMHFAARYNDDVDERFGVATMCSEVEGPDVRRKVNNVVTFPYERQALARGVLAIPTPGHRHGAVSYLVRSGKRSCLFAGDTIYHDLPRRLGLDVPGQQEEPQDHAPDPGHVGRDRLRRAAVEHGRKQPSLFR